MDEVIKTSIISNDYKLRIGLAYHLLVNGQGVVNSSMSISTSLTRIVETSAQDLVCLIRGSRVYPLRHPALLGVVERILAAVPLNSTGLFTRRVTPTEFVVCGEFVGGKAARPASPIHAREVLRILRARDARLEEETVQSIDVQPART